MSGAQALFRDFVERIDHYAEARNFPAVKGPSYLSVHLRFGTISIRQLAAYSHAQSSRGAQVWLSELIWRDFYHAILWHHPRVVGDVATLTGACVIALGHHHSGLFTTDETLASQMLKCGESALDPCWRLPLDDEYDEGLKSNFADMGNVGPRAGGAITAAMFLKRYTAKYPWVHLDIAGTAWKSGAAKGGTGRPVPLLTQFVLSQQD